MCIIAISYLPHLFLRFFKTILKSKRGINDMYLLLIRNNIVSNGQKKWEEILALGLDETKWREIFKLPFIVIQNTKLQWLIQYRINHTIKFHNIFGNVKICL
jgi:hypothetical protein